MFMHIANFEIVMTCASSNIIKYTVYAMNKLGVLEFVMVLLGTW